MNAYIRRKKKATNLDHALLHFVFERLKEDPNSPHSMRVRRAITLLIKARDLAGYFQGLLPLRELNSLLRRYEWQDQLSVNVDGLHLGQYMTKPVNPSEGDHWEAGALHHLVELTKKEDGIHRLRECVVCGEPFFAGAGSRADKTFCGLKCRQQNYYSNPVNRRKKLDKMRENYANATGRENRTKERIGYVAPRKMNAKKPR